MMTSKENKRKGRNFCSSSDVVALWRQKCQRTCPIASSSSQVHPPDNVDITSQTMSPTIPTTSSTKLPLISKKGHSIPRDKRPAAPPYFLVHQALTTSQDNEVGDNVDITSQSLSPTIPTASSTKPPLTAKNGPSIPQYKRPAAPPSSKVHPTHITSPTTQAPSSSTPRGARTHSHPSHALPPTIVLRTPCLGDSPYNDSEDNVDITSQPLSPTIPTASSTKRLLTARNGNDISKGARTHLRQSDENRSPRPTVGLRTPCLGDSLDDANGTLQPLSPTISTSSTKPPLTARGQHCIPRDKRRTNIIGQVIKRKFDGVWPRYSHVQSDVRKKWWDDFKSHWYISEDNKDLVRSLFEKMTGERLRDMLYEARKCYKATRNIPEWIHVIVFEKILDFWKNEKFIRSSDANTSNMNHNYVEGLPMGTYNGGSRSFHDTKVLMEKLCRRPVSIAEVFMCTHTNKENKEPIDESAAAIEELFKEKMPHILPYFG